MSRSLGHILAALLHSILTSSESPSSSSQIRSMLSQSMRPARGKRLKALVGSSAVLRCFVHFLALERDRLHEPPHLNAVGIADARSLIS